MLSSSLVERSTRSVISVSAGADIPIKGERRTSLILRYFFMQYLQINNRSSTILYRFDSLLFTFTENRGNLYLAGNL